mmetsp:Transcript_1670/g.3973  ORF Transcript_1670/g.3973 Transcript_1670/m.3973 type:complete len:215 (-) Transcript_1670:369-1013(-)
MKISIITTIIAAVAILAVGGYAIEDEDFAADLGVAAETTTDEDVDADFLANTDVEIEGADVERDLGSCSTKYWGWYHGYWCHCGGNKYKGKCKGSSGGYDCDEYWWGDCKWKKCYYKTGKYAYKKKIRCKHSDSSSSDYSYSHSDSSSSSYDSSCKKRKRKCCNCVDSCESEHSSSSDEHDCIKDDCKDKCKKAADACPYYKKSEWDDFYDDKC